MAVDGVPEVTAARAGDAGVSSDPVCDRLVARIQARHGPGVCAVVVYGSYLRGRRDTLLDFYVLLEGYRSLRPAWQAALAWMLSPNVYQVQAGEPPDEARAKYALMTLGRFERAMRRDFHSYYWARFAQPCGLLYCRDAAVRERLVAALAEAGRRFVIEVVPRLPDEFTAEDLVTAGFALTYGCELRTEPPGQAAMLFAHAAAYYRELVAALSGGEAGYRALEGAGHYRNLTGSARRRRSVQTWALRRVYGKIKSALRLVKAAFTFKGGFDYLLWKIRRHSGHYIEPTERQRRYPLLFGWPLLWRLYRLGAFR